MAELELEHARNHRLGLAYPSPSLALPGAHGFHAHTDIASAWPLFGYLRTQVTVISFPPDRRLSFAFHSISSQTSPWPAYSRFIDYCHLSHQVLVYFPTNPWDRLLTTRYHQEPLTRDIRDQLSAPGVVCQSINAAGVCGNFGSTYGYGYRMECFFDV